MSKNDSSVNWSREIQMPFDRTCNSQSYTEERSK
jgi:hypothetical protein